MTNSNRKWNFPMINVEIPSPTEDVDDCLHTGDAEGHLINEPTQLSGEEFDEWMRFVTYCGQEDHVSQDVIEEVTRSKAQPGDRKRNCYLRMNRRKR